MLKFNNDGAYFVSETGREYEVLEGVTIIRADGVRKTSDKNIVYRLDDDGDEYVGFVYGDLINDKDVAKYIDEMIEEFEVKKGFVKSINLDTLGGMMGIPVTHL